MVPYIIKSFRGGISDENNKGVAGAYQFGYGLDIHSRNDVLTTKQAMATIFGSTNTTQTGIIQFFVPASDGTTYCFGSTGSIFARTGDGQFIFVYNEENGKIKGAAEWKLSGGTNYLYWATGTSLARKELGGAEIAVDSGAARWTDVTADYKTTLTSADWHTIHQGSGVLGIANGESLATVDFDGNFDSNNLNVRPGNLIKAIDERDDFFILGSTRTDLSEQGHIWSWITTAAKWVQKKKIAAKGVNALINTEFPLAQAGDQGELFLSDFVNPVPLHGIPGGGQSDPGGVSIENGIAVFGIYGSNATYPGIWSYGRKRKNRSLALNYDYRLAGTVTGSAISTISAVTMVDGVLLASWGTTDGSTSDYGIDSVSSTTKATGLYEGLKFDGGSPHLRKPFNAVKVIMDALPSGASISIKYRKDNAVTGGDSSAREGFKYATTSGQTSTTFSVAGETEALFSIGDASTKYYEVGVEINPSGDSTVVIHAIVSYIGDAEGNETYEFA